MDYKTPVLVLGGCAHTTLGVIRAFARTAIPQFTVGVGTGYVSRSRWHRRLPDRNGKDPTPDSLAGFLESLPIEQLVLLPCSDPWLSAVARLPPSFAERFPASLAPVDSVATCLDKGRLVDTLRCLGLPHARTISINAHDDVRARWTGELRDPFLKPRSSNACLTHFGVKAFRPTTAAEASVLVEEARQAGVELMLQEYIPGPASSHFFVDGFVNRAGSICARFARRRIRTFREPFGDSSSVTAIPLEEAKAQIEILNRLLPALRYRGVFNAQFKYDGRDGAFKLIDLNPRPWGSIGLAVSCGVDVVHMAYQDALGLAVEPVLDYPAGRRWVFGPRDLTACWRLLREGRASPAAWIREWAGAEHPIFRWDDPAPAAAFCFQALRKEVGSRRVSA